MAKKITSRERVKIALEHREADRVPIDLGAMRSTGVATIAYNKLRRELGITKDLARMYDFIQQLAYPEEEVLQEFNVDVIDSGQAFLKDKKNWKEWTLNDGSKCLIPQFINTEIDENGAVLIKNNNGIVLGKKPESSLYLDQVYWPMSDLPSIPQKIDSDILSDNIWSVPSPPWHLDIFKKDDYETFKSNIKKLYQETDYSIMLAVGCDLLGSGNCLRGMDKFLTDIMVDRKGTERLFDRLVEKNLELLDRVLEGVGQYIDLLQFNEDLGYQQGLFIPPEIFQSVFKPRYKCMWDFVHDNSSCKIFLHSCGSVYKVIPELIEAGLDVLNPVQTTAADMEPERLKKEFGKDLTFWGGGCNTRDILPGKSPREVREDVKKRMEIFKPGGGFIFCQIHNILADVPPENIIAMLEAAYDYGKY